MQIYKKYIKRLIDIAASGGALLVLSLPLAAVTLWLHFANKGAGAFFRQERPGKDGKIFKVVKFKTMTDERDAEGRLLPDADRLTKVGRFVRSTSIDELPQLWNVLKGDMSLIGPPPRSAPRHHRLGAVPRPQRHLLAEEIRTRHLVRRPHLLSDRLQGHLDHLDESDPPRRHKFGDSRHNGSLQRE